MTLTETKDGYIHYFTQGYKPSYEPACLSQKICPCPRVTPHLVCNCHLMACAPFPFPLSVLLFLTYRVYSALLTTASQNTKPYHRAITHSPGGLHGETHSPHPDPNDAIVKTTKALICTAEKTITTGLCPGGRLRMERLLRVLEMKRVDPTLMTTHTFPFDEMERAFEIMDKKLDGVLKPLIVF